MTLAVGGGKNKFVQKTSMQHLTIALKENSESRGGFLSFPCGRF